MRFTVLVGVALVAGCADETISGYANREATYRLEEMHGAPVEWPATIRFPERGRVVGQGPCNDFSAAQSLVYPWIEVAQPNATRRMCPDMAAEQGYLEALQAAHLVEVSGPVLILTDDTGREMVFRAQSH
ncbi:heat shock protein HslJ [Aliiruegeria haliotis]|uniref:Heat shock protein HslJ n=1 Tax=Aliiruegeria haliotis TaxID=1280846 RepID=A0A2T0RGM9_9RHOB|nr:META domain-containing protein [Aliiruegeria haliotis]PRY20260.1 heat shock protein HslJ [Aliiruegeria haliotis]